MKKVLLGVLAAALLTGAAPIAHAAGETLTGGCTFDTNRQATATNGENVGVIGSFAFAQKSDGTPASATVSCKIQVNGSDAPGTEFSYTGTGPIVGSNQISFHAEDTDSVALCEKVDFGSGGSYDCSPADSFQIPPDEVFTVLDLIFTTLEDAEIAFVDPVICPILASLHGTYGPFVIDPDGDLSLVPDPTSTLFPPGLFTPIWDCPPYRTTP